MSIDKSIFDQYTVFMRNKHFLFGHNHPAHAIHRLRDRFAIKLPNVFVPVRTETIASIFMQPQVKGRSMLYHGFVQRRQHHVIILVQLGYRDNQQPMLFSSIAINDCRTMIGPRLIGPQHLFRQRPFEIYHQILVKFQITHISTIKFLLFLSKNSRMNL